MNICKMGNNIDTLFRKALQEKGCEPPSRVWENIAEHLEAKKKRRRMAMWWYSSAAGFLLLIALTCMMQLRPDRVEIMPVATSVNHQNPVIPEPENEIIPVLSPMADIPAIQIIEDERFLIEKELPFQIKSLKYNSVDVMPISGLSLRNSVVRTDIIPLINKNAYKTNLQYQQLLAENRGTERVRPKSWKISLSGHFAPGYTSGSYQKPAAQVATYDYSKEQLSGIFNMGGGVKVAISGGKRFSVQTGIVYTQLGQRSRSSVPGFVRGEQMMAAGSAYNVHRTPLGKVKNRAGQVFFSPGYVTVLPGNKSAVDEKIDLLFGAVEIPLAVKYRLNDNKVSFTVSGGISGSFIVSNKAYLYSGNKREFIGSTENIRDFNVSTDLGIGIEYPVTPQIRVMVEPGFRYYLQSLSYDRSVDFKPYTFSFSTGIGINF